MVIVHVRLIQSALGQKVEAEPRGLPHWERSQGRAITGGREVARLPGEMELHLGWNHERWETAFPLPTALGGNNSNPPPANPVTLLQVVLNVGQVEPHVPPQLEIRHVASLHPVFECSWSDA